VTTVRKTPSWPTLLAPAFVLSFVLPVPARSSVDAGPARRGVDRRDARGASARPADEWRAVPTGHAVPASGQAQAAKVWTQEDMLRRNVGTREDQLAQFPPHNIIGNVYYVGTRTLASYLVATPEGHVLINTNWEAGVPGLKDSVEKLGFRFSDIKIILGSHAHGDHMEGDALVKEMTGAQVMAMAEDVPALERMRPGDKPHPIDRVLNDGDRVTLGGSTLVARLTPGHTRGCTTWTMDVRADGRSYSVVIIGSMGSNPGFQFVNNPTNPTIADEYRQGFKVLRSLKADVPLASHPAMYGMAEKFARIGKGPNPFIDPAGYTAELDLVEDLFRRVLAEQQKAAGVVNR
jgi:metallo-beta-lactamase class B